jgi:hypothetical protein
MLQGNKNRQFLTLKSRVNVTEKKVKSQVKKGYFALVESPSVSWMFCCRIRVISVIVFG